MTLRKLNIVNSILLLLVFTVLAIIFNDVLIYKRATKRISVTPVKIDSTPVREPIEKFAFIVENPVFPGKPKRFAPSTSLTVTAATPHRVDATGILKKIKLTGTYVSDKLLSNSFAVFNKVDGRIQKSFHPGENVFGFGILSNVSDDTVTIKAGAKEFLFKMPKRLLPTKYTPELPARIKSGPVTGGSKSRSLKYSKKVSDTEWVINQDAVLVAMNDMSSILSDARMTPLTDNGKVNGFKVTEIRRAGIFDAIGLRNNDIIKRVNNYDMTSPERAIQVLSALKGKRNFSIDIERNGKNLSLNYRVR